MLVALGACAIAGFISGFFVVKLGVNSFIATLGMSQVITAFILHTSEPVDHQPVQAVLPWTSARRRSSGCRCYFFYLLILAVIIWFVFEHTPLGRFMFATGGNPEAARLAGVRTNWLVWGSLVASGLIAGLAGMVYSWKVGNYAQSVGPGYLFPAVAAVFFGASQLKGTAQRVGHVDRPLRAGLRHQGPAAHVHAATRSGSSRCSRACRCWRRCPWRATAT